MKKIIKQIGLMCMLGISTTVGAQTTWYFGNKGGLIFNGSTTSAASTTGMSINTSENSAVLMDNNGNVIMYSDGIKIWNGSHVQQATSTLLNGDLSSTQGVAIVPVASNNSFKAFIFTVTSGATNFGYANSTIRGLRVSLATITNSGTELAPNYSISINNNSSEYNYNLINSTGGGLMSERISVIADGKGGHWVVTHGAGYYDNTTPIDASEENNFYAYHVTCSSTTPATLAATQVKSDMSGFSLSPHRSFGSLSGGTIQNNAAGQMKFSPSGTRLICTIPYRGNNNWLMDPTAQIYTFNLTTGSFSSPLEFNLGFQHTSGSSTNDGAAYGVEYSPDGAYVYVSSTRASGAIQNMKSRIYRYDVTTSNASTISASKTALTGDYTITGNAGVSYQGLMRGPNDKIYIAKTQTNSSNQSVAVTSLDVISSPNSGTSVSTGVSISGNSLAGLPTTITYKRPIDPTFNLAVTRKSGYYTLTSTPVDLNGFSLAGFNYCWRVEGYTNSNYTTQEFKFEECMYTTLYWNEYPGATNYKRFDHIANAYTCIPCTLTSGTPDPGQFRYNYNYKLTRTASSDACGWAPDCIYLLNVQPSGMVMFEKLSGQAGELLLDGKQVATTGIKTFENENDSFIVYPNPSNGIFNIEVSKDDKTNIEVIDAFGKLIKTLQLSKNERYELDLSGYAKGMYLIRMNGTQQGMKKIILD